MNRRTTVTCILSIALGLMAFGADLQAQLTMDIPIAIADNGDGAQPGRDTLYLGFKPGATNGIDGELGEDQQPPAPPEGVFDVRWVNVGSSSNFGQGVKRNYHAYFSPAQKDTFRMRLQPGFMEGKSGYPVTISWPPLAPYFTTASLRFVDGDGESQSLDMMAAAAFTFTNPSSITSTVTITTEGPRDPASSVAIQDLAASLELTNAPNPVRRGEGSRISYMLQQSSYVSIRVYNVLGEHLATLLNGHQAAGRHSVRLATEEMVPGRYYYTVETSAGSAARTFILTD